MNSSNEKNLSIMLGILEDAGYFLWFDRGMWFFSIAEDFEDAELAYSIYGKDKYEVIQRGFQNLIH